MTTRRPVWWMLAVGLLLATLGAGIGLAIRWKLDAPPNTLTAAEAAFARRDYRAAETHARRVWDGNGDGAAARLVARAAAAQGRFDEALRWFDRVADDSPAALAARLEAADLLLFQLKRLSDAEAQLRRALALDADNLDAAERLAFLLGLSSRAFEATPYRLALVRAGRFDGVHLYLLALAEKALENPQAVAEYAQAAPSDPLPRLAAARGAIVSQDFGRARTLLEELVTEQPPLMEAWARLGRVDLDTRADAEFLRWQSQLPRAAEAHPEVWAVQGMWAQRHDRPRVAIRCFVEALQRDPTHETANYQLGRLLLEQGDSETAARLLERARQLQDYGNAAKVAFGDGRLSSLLRAAERAAALGLLWEASGWTRLAHAAAPDAAEVCALRRRIEPRLADLPLVRLDPQADLLAHFDQSAYPLPQGEAPTTARADDRNRAETLGIDLRNTAVTFEDRAAEAGIDFRYFNDPSPPGAGAKMYEFTGGGVAVLDYDRNGWPDLYLTQGCRWAERGRQTRAATPVPGNAAVSAASGAGETPALPGSTTLSRDLDQLYRNAGTGRFVNVTAAAGLAETGFSQGVTVGDFDSDGFADLYVANIGRNRLYRNNGDGTFADVTAASGTAGADDDWTTSCLLADLDGDALPDLYAVNYLSGPDVFERLCPDASGKPRSCLPQHFEGAQDRVYLNLGDGRFEEQTRPAGIVVPQGKGLGIVAADFEQTGRLSLFIANDAVPNFLFINESRTAGTLRFSEQALLRGVALNRFGRVEACMGVAAGDSDGDGRLDLFVTNFHQETNTLYRQSDGGTFVDVTADAGIDQPSLPMLGFGTQFLDGELDGALDLIVTNGHVEDRRDLGIPWQMPPQYFRNRGDGRFEELSAARLGPFFARPALGRGLARLDWNRDGREEVAISLLDAPAALLTNTTAAAGGFLALDLHGTTSNRDALGAIVTATVNGRTLVRQLTAGDGYQASNQRRLVFGLGPAAEVEHLHIRWPSGRVQTFEHLPANRELCLIEGHPHPLRAAPPADGR